MFELPSGSRLDKVKTENGKLKSAPSISMEVADEGAQGSSEPNVLNGKVKTENGKVIQI